MITLACILFGTQYVNHETPGYFWDYVTYQNQLQQLEELIHGGHLYGFLSFVKSSLSESNYNVSPILPLLPFSLALGSSRLIFISLLITLYLVPAAIVMTFLIRECWRCSRGEVPFLPSFGFVVLAATFWAPTLRGYPDIAGLIPLGIATILILRSHWLLDASMKRSLLIGLMLWITFLLRRHYAYTISATISMTLLFAVRSIVSRQGARLSMLARLFRNTISAGLAMAIPAAFLQGSLLLKILNTSYAEAHSAYQEVTSAQLTKLYLLHGPVWTGLLLTGTIFIIWQRNGKAFFCLATALLSYILFQRVQAPDLHHTLAFAFWLIPVVAWPLQLIESQEQRLQQIGLEALLLGLVASASIPMVAWPELRRTPLLRWSGPLQPTASVPPFRLASYNAISQLTQELESQKYANREFLILASSTQLNHSIIQSMSRKISSRVYSAGNVDQTDGFNTKLALRADYIVTTWKPSLHLRPTDQRVVTLPTAALFNPATPLARLYSRLPNKSFSLADGTTAYIFKRIGNPSTEVVTWLEDEFRRYYPKWRQRDGMIKD